MKREDLKKEMNNILNNKKIKDAVVVVLILAFLLIVISFFTDTKKGEVKTTDGPAIVEETNENAENVNIETQKYEEKQRSELESILKKIEGVGDVEVMMHFKSGEVKVPAVDNNSQVAVTEETDREGGTRHNDQKTDGSKVVMKTLDGDNEPVILQTNNPTITGIIVAAEGAGNSKIKYDIQMAVSRLYEISLDKVNVYLMES